MGTTLAVGLAPGATGYPGASFTRGREEEESLWNQLEQARASMVPWWRECARFSAPRATRFAEDADRRGQKYNKDILNEIAVYCSRTLRSGMHWGISNPSREWFGIRTGIPNFDEREDIRVWEHETTSRIMTVLGLSNFYDIQSIIYGDAINFATGAYIVEEDERTVIRLTPWAIGSFGIADDQHGDACTASRRISMTVRQIVKKWGATEQGRRRFSTELLEKIKNSRWEETLEIAHLIYPNPEHDDQRDLPQFYPFRSVYWEIGRAPKDDTQPPYLELGGYHEFPVIVFRWGRAPDEAYGIDCPTMQALGAVKSAQVMESKGLKLLDKLIDPPMTGPAELENNLVSILPGAFTATRDPNVRFQAAHEVRAEGLNHLRADKQALEQRIHDIYYTRLMLLIANDTRAQRPTATEVQEGSQEKYLVLGSVLESFNGAFRRFIDRTYGIMSRAGYIPDAPEDIAGIPLMVEYTSIMAIAQKSVGLSSYERWGATALELQEKSNDPAVAATLNWPQYLRELEKRSGLDPGILRSEEDVQRILDAQAEQQQRINEAELAKAESEAARNLSGASLDGNNMLAASAQQAGEAMAGGSASLTDLSDGGFQ